MNDIPEITPTSRLLIIGTSGSGKSTLAQEISKNLNLLDIELDALFWKPHWTQSSLEEFRMKIEEVLSKSSGHVIHGNYTKVHDLTWGNSDIIFWLDYSKSLIMWRVLKRSFLRILRRENLYSNNRETFKKTFLSKDSIILWSWNTYDLRKEQYAELIKKPEYSKKRIMRFKSPKEASRLLHSIKKSI